MSLTMRDQPLPDHTTYDPSPKSSNCSAHNKPNRQFESYVEELKVYIETHGHMNVTREENESIYSWIDNIRDSYKKIKEGRTPHTRLPPDRMNMLRQIHFQFESSPSVHVQVSFESRIEALKIFKEKHGHLLVSKKKDKSLHFFVNNVKQSVKRMQEGKTPRHIKLTPDRMEMLKELGFQFESRSKTLHVSFESRIEALRLYQAKHGHMHVPKKDDASLYNFIATVRKGIMNMKEGQTPYFKLTPDRMEKLQEIGFQFKSENHHVSFESRIEALQNYQAKHGHMRVSATEDKSLHNYIKRVRQSVKRKKEGKKSSLNLTPNQMTTLEEIGFNLNPKRGRACLRTPSTSCSSFSKRQRVEERLLVKQEEIPMSRTFTAENKTEQEDMEEIEGDVIPRWLISDEEEEENNDNSFLDEISIDIDG